MRWPGFLEERRGVQPYILILHLGENNLQFMKGKSRDDMKAIKSRWPEVILLWSVTVPRLVWRGASYRRGVEKDHVGWPRNVYFACRVESRSS